VKYAIADRRIVCEGENFIAPTAAVIGSVVLARNASIWFNAVVRGDHETITIGEGSQIQDGCVLHADPGVPIVIERDVSVGHMAMLHGCSIGEGSLIGIRSVILNHARIGKHCLIGAGSLVPERKVIPDGVLALGVPARVVRALSAEEIAALRQNALDYQALACRFREGLRPENG
jgi:carbonic anhydrase/acetyltransferase-like protein (isoleucine patch superfamily)